MTSRLLLPTPVGFVTRAMIVPSGARLPALAVKVGAAVAVRAAGGVGAGPGVVLAVRIGVADGRLVAVADDREALVPRAGRRGDARDRGAELGEIAGRRLDLAARGAAVAVRRIAVVALLTGVEEAV